MSTYGPENNPDKQEEDAMDVDAEGAAATAAQAEEVVSEFSIAQLTEAQQAACAKFDITAVMLLSGFEEQQVRDWVLRDPTRKEVLKQQVDFANKTFPGLYFERFKIDIPEDLAEQCAYWSISADELLEGFDYEKSSWRTADNDVNDLEAQQTQFAQDMFQGVRQAKAGIFTSSTSRLDDQDPSPRRFNQTNIGCDGLLRVLSSRLDASASAENAGRAAADIDPGRQAYLTMAKRNADQIRDARTDQMRWSKAAGPVAELGWEVDPDDPTGHLNHVRPK